MVYRVDERAYGISKLDTANWPTRTQPGILNGKKPVQVRFSWTSLKAIHSFLSLLVFLNALF